MWIQKPSLSRSHVHVFEGVHLYVHVHTHVCGCYSLIFRSVLELLSILRLRQALFLNPSSPIWLGWWPISSRGFLLSDLLALRLLTNLAFMWDCGSSCSYDKHFINWVISPTSFHSLDLSFLIYKMGTIMIETIKWANNKAIRELYIILQVLIWLIIGYYY